MTVAAVDSGAVATGARLRRLRAGTAPATGRGLERRWA